MRSMTRRVRSARPWEKGLQDGPDGELVKVEPRLKVLPGRGLHSSIFQLILSRFSHTSPRPAV